MQRTQKQEDKLGRGCIDVMLAQTFDETKHDPTGWLMSEKLDGVRCYWDGKNMYSRAGNKINAPEEWIICLPNIALDGELWSGRDDFQSIVSTVKRNTPDPKKWESIKFMVFDAPLLPGGFANRIRLLEKKIKKDPLVKVCEQTVCKGFGHLIEQMDIICGKKGEGIMVKDPDSKYEGRRSWNLLKVKRFEDAEATVTGHQAGTGRLTGMCGAILV